MVRFEEVNLTPLKLNAYDSNIKKANEVIYRFLKRGYTECALFSMERKLKNIINRMTNEEQKKKSLEEVEGICNKIAITCKERFIGDEDYVAGDSTVRYAEFFLIRARNEGDFQNSPYYYYEILMEVWKSYIGFLDRNSRNLFYDIKKELLSIMTKGEDVI